MQENLLMIDTDKQHNGIEAVIECLLNRGLSNEEDTCWFADVKHADLIQIFLDYLNSHRHFLGYCHIDSRQALNDRGVDVSLSSDTFKAGFQIKSHFDVASSDFSATVKRQFAEALSYGLSHYYLLICSPLYHGQSDFRMKIAHLLNDVALFQKVTFDTFGPLNTVTIFKQPLTITREELLIRKAISNQSLHEHEKGYEHLPEVYDDDIQIAEERLHDFGDDWVDSNEGMAAFKALQEEIERKQAEQFVVTFAPTLPAEVKQKRSELITEIHQLLAQCRACKSWDNRSEYKLPSWLDHVPESMIPYTAMSNLLRLRKSIMELLCRHQK